MAASKMMDFSGLEQQYGLPNGLLAAVAHTESAGNPNAVSPKGAQGLFQFMPATAQQYGINPLDPQQAADGAARYYADLLKQNNGNLDAALASYNFGPGNVAAGKPLPQETQDYIKKVKGLLPQQTADSGQIISDGLPSGFVLDSTQKSGEMPEGFVLDSANTDKTPDMGALHAISSQATQGLTGGFADELTAYPLAAIDSLIKDKPFRETLKNVRASQQADLQSQQENHPIASALGQLVGGVAGSGAIAETKAGSALADFLGSGNRAARMGKGALAGAASGAVYGAGNAPDEQKLEGAKQGAIYGGVAGGVIPAVGAAFGAVKNAILPSAPADVKPLAKKALDYGIPLSRSQIGDSKVAKTLASTVNEIPLSGSQKFYQKQSSAFNKAIANTFGEDADKITPEVIDAAYTNIGKIYDSALAGKNVPITNSTIKTLNQIQDEADNYITPDHANIVRKAIDKVVGAQKGGGGTIAGEKLGSLRSQITEILKQTRNDASPYLSKVRDAIIDMSTTAAPELRKANAQYKALKTIEPLAVKATESGGNISPALLQQRVAQSYRNYSRGGGGDLGDLARIGQRFLKETVPNSGTAKRLASYHALAALPGAAVGYYENPQSPVSGAILGGLGTMALARGVNAANTSPRLVRGALQAGNNSALLSLLSANSAAQIGGTRGRIGLKKRVGGNP